MVEPRSARARALVDYLARAKAPFAELVAVDVQGPRDLVDLIVEPELAQHRQVAILAREPIRLGFDPDDASAPRVASLRADFPTGVHTNREGDEDGLFLCIWEEGWADLRRGLTAQALVERIRDWFTRTADGTLHQEGQALEPLLPASADLLILPAGDPPETLHVEFVYPYKGRWTLGLSADAVPHPPIPPFAILQWKLGPVVHGALGAHPHNLADLADALGPLGLDLSQTLAAWFSAEAALQGLAKRHLLLLIWIAKQAVADGPVEGWEARAYMPAQTLGDLGMLFGRTMLDLSEIRLAHRVPAHPVGDLTTVALQGWRIVQRLDRGTARQFAGNPATADARLVAIGAGAIGSHLIANTVRAGIGQWTVIDDDVVLPHNTVRQIQPDRAVGLPKVEALALAAGPILAQASVEALRADILAPGDAAPAIAQAFATADLVCDLSASPAVLGAVADHADVRRAASLFFNPDGTDLVLLAEDAARAIRLDELEAQYFLAATSDRLADHLGAARLDRLRYANACQDLSRPLPPWQVQTLAGIASGALLRCLAGDSRQAALWRLDPATGQVEAHSLLLSDVYRFPWEGFRTTLSAQVIATMRALRGGAAPNETGGILIGSFDADRRVLHIVEALPAPADSRQSPSYFVRGAHALAPELALRARRSAAVLGYVGEWHSHPDGAVARPSGDDEKLYAFLHDQIDPAGAPYAMLICGAKQTWLRVGWYRSPAGEGVIDYG